MINESLVKQITDFGQFASRVYRRIMSLTGIGKVNSTTDDKNNQYMQVRMLPDQLLDVRKLGHYGLAYVPPKGSDAFVIFLGGDRQNGVAIATENQASRLKNLKAGEAALYDDQGQMIYIKRTGIVIEGNGKPIHINGNMQITGNVVVTGSFGVTGAFGVIGDLSVNGNITATGDITPHV